MTKASAVMREQIARGIGIPRELYTSQELYEREVEAIFQTSWLLAGHESQLPAVGDYLTVEVGDESVIVARSRSGLSAYANVCRHRGARLVDPGCGSARILACPYHQWAYEMDGSMRGAPKMPPGFDRTAYPLAGVAVETWQGLVFVNLAQDPPPLSSLLAPAEQLILPFDLAEASVAHTITYDVAANWKIVWENAQECYHCSANHPELMRTFDLTSGSIEGVYRSADRRVQVTPLPLRRGAVSLTVDGDAACSLPLGAFGAGREPYTAALHMKPTFAVVCCPDYAVILRDRPIAIDRTEVTMTWLVRAGAEEGRHYDLDNLIKVWDQTNVQDWALCERTQLGVRSRFFQPGPLSGDEPSVAGFHQAYAALLAAAGL